MNELKSLAAALFVVAIPIFVFFGGPADPLIWLLWIGISLPALTSWGSKYAIGATALTTGFLLYLMGNGPDAGLAVILYGWLTIPGLALTWLYLFISTASKEL